MFANCEIEWRKDRDTSAMDHIGKYFYQNGYQDEFDVICKKLYWYISCYGTRPVEYIETEFLKSMGVESR